MWNLSPLPPPRGTVPRHLLSEDELAEVWAQRAYAARYLEDCCGRQLRVVFPGRRWGGPGPDFVGAVLAERNGRLERGDVEVHRRASNWISHRHALDPLYAGVVLHVVQVADVPPVDWGGRHLHTVVLAPEPGRGPPGPVRAPCVREAPAVLQVVEAAGHERFRARVARFEGDLTAVDADQVLWRGVCEALGYQRNTQAFGQLADALPWAQAAQVVADRGPVGLAGALLGAAGLERETTLPEAHAWRALQRALGLRPALSPTSWDRRQLRAANAPELRCRGLAEVAARWTCTAPQHHGSDSRRGPAQQVVDWRHGPAEQVLEAVRQAARVRRPSLWRLIGATPWIGRGRAQVTVINVLLPFAAAAGVAEAESLFARYPGEPRNRVVRYMAEQLGAPGVHFRGACRQQGLLHLFKLTCAGRVCERCPARAHSQDATSWLEATSKY